ncbi:MAG: stage II sporulation protein M [Pseudomonadota bacterium]
MTEEAQIRSARFRAEREADWRQLEVLVAQVERQGLQRMEFAAARDLAALYRQATTSLAIAREISLDRALLAYLEALTARAYLSVYAPQEPLGGVFARFFARSAPQAMRRAWPFLLIGFLSMALGGLVGFLLYLESPAWFYVFVPEDLAGGRSPAATTEALRAVIYDERPTAQGLSAFAAYLFSHNTRIAILIFGLGVFFCAPAIILTFYNGLVLGAFLGLHIDRGLGWDLLGWLSVHGVTEISAICIACGGGVMLGAAVLFPGRARRADALQATGRVAVKLALVAALMLVAAALLEGFARQLVQSLDARLALGWGVGLAWLIWILGAGRARA